nr:hypothetical protein [Tanacetum cinerariifolium]
KQLLYYCLPCCAEKSKETKDLLSTLPLLIAHLGDYLRYYCLPCCAEKSKETKDLLSTLPLLIAHLGAVTFAAIYTARGGDSNDGMPVVVHKTSFKIFNFNGKKSALLKLQDVVGSRILNK